MAIYRNNSTFPTYLFSRFDNENFESFASLYSSISEREKSIQKIITTRNNKLNNFREFIIENFKELENQQLFSFLVTHLEQIHFSRILPFKKDELENKSISDFRVLQVLNYRFNLKNLHNYIELLKEDKHVISINEEKLVSFFLKITYKYSFTTLASCIYASTDDLKESMNFTEEINYYEKYTDDLKNGNYDKLNIDMKKMYIQSFQESFSNQNTLEINFIIQELKEYLKDGNVERKLGSLLTNNIIFDSNISKTLKNRLLLPLFKNMICVISYPLLSDTDLKDPDLIEKFKKYSQRISL